MKYKVGQKVRVRSDLKYGREWGGIFVTKSMFALAGKIVTIEEVERNSYWLKDGGYSWADEMFQPLSIEDVQTGDIVKEKDCYFGILFTTEHLVFKSCSHKDIDEVFNEDCVNAYSKPEFAKAAKINGWTLYSPDEVKEEMIDIDGKEISKSTIKAALKDYVE